MPQRRRLFAASATPAIAMAAAASLARALARTASIRWFTTGGTHDAATPWSGTLRELAAAVADASALRTALPKPSGIDRPGSGTVTAPSGTRVL